MVCDGCGWCEGSPAFTCPRCRGTGEEPAQIAVPGVRVLGRNGYFRNARFEVKPDGSVELWLGTPKEKFPLIVFPAGTEFPGETLTLTKVP